MQVNLAVMTQVWPTFAKGKIWKKSNLNFYKASASEKRKTVCVVVVLLAAPVGDLFEDTAYYHVHNLRICFSGKR